MKKTLMFLLLAIFSNYSYANYTSLSINLETNLIKKNKTKKINSFKRIVTDFRLIQRSNISRKEKINLFINYRFFSNSNPKPKKYTLLIIGIILVFLISIALAILLLYFFILLFVNAFSSITFPG